MKHALILGLAGVLLSSAAIANSAEKTHEARIPFADHGSIEGWQTDGEHALYLEGPGMKWYRAELMGYCPDLPFADAIGFETRGTGDFDRFSSIVVHGRRCPLKSLVESGPPPRKRNSHKS